MTKMRIIFCVIFLACFASVISVCPNSVLEYTIPTFGGNCKYRCHCAGDEQCNNNTGDCPNDCENGWMGPACQYRNIAMNNTNIRQHGATDAQDGYGTLAVDGNTATCSRTNPTDGSGEQYWWIELSRMYYIVGLIIHRPDGDPQKTLRVETTNTTAGDENPSFDNADVQLCAQINVDQTTLTTEVMCTEPVIANTLRVVQEGSKQPLSLCEVQIYGGRHVSFNQDTTQDSTLDWGGHTWYSRLAVDGTGAVEAGDKQGLTCSATYTGGQRWWQLNLPIMYRIEDVYIFGRIDNANQISRFNMSIDGTIVYHDTHKPASQYLPWTLDLNVPRDGKVIRVSRLGILVMCEVLVFSECLPNKCGWDCTEDCMCNSVTTGTPRMDATCPYGCTERWTGTNDKCNTECSATEWGPDCKSTCGHCANNASCDVTTGICPGGCTPSWKPEMCTEKCDDGRWGVNCSQECGNCLPDSTCDKENGVCLAGCMSGYKPPDCTEVCDPGTYGQNCSSKCGNCTSDDGVDNTICRTDTGVCPDGCPPGVQPPKCDAACDDGNWGLNCSNSCGYCTTNTACNNVDGVCPDGCLPGYKQPYCAEECDPGSYGQNCSFMCGNCTSNDGVNTTICLPDTGVCPDGCPPGLQPPTCNKSCDPGTYGQNCSSKCGNCTSSDGVNTTICLPDTGVCPDGCPPGLQPPKCDKLCDPGTYGQNCSSKCGNCTSDDGANTTICLPDTGVCPDGCPLGLQPPTCDELCGPGTYGQNCSSKCGNCTSSDGVNTTICLPDTGVCPDGCPPGSQPPKCDKSCDQGTYGQNRSSKCGSCTSSDGVNITICFPDTGVCPDGCPPGLQPPKCDKLCDPGTYGQNCSSKCGNCTSDDGVNTTICLPDTGVCPDGCPPGLQPPTCDKLCGPGTYGQNCSSKCGNCTSSDGVNTTICLPDTGVCPDGCPPGSQPPKCDKSCDQGTYGQNRSSKCGSCTSSDGVNITICFPDTGVCPDGCPPGLQPPKLCDPGTYGQNCSSKCGNCTSDDGVNTTICLPDTGVCPDGCPPGLQPPTCDKLCGPGTYGQNCSSKCGNCTSSDGVNTTICLPDTGVCPDGCPPGSQPPKCDKSCDPGTYGQNCGSKCGNCTSDDVVNTTICLPDTGVCPDGCPPGSQPPTCDSLCATGTFGNKCNGTCNTCRDKECRHDNGHCRNGCEDGYNGVMCRQKQAPPPTTNPGAIGGGVAGACLLIIVAVAALIIYRKRRPNISIEQAKKDDLIGKSLDTLNNGMDEIPEVPTPTGSELYQNHTSDMTDIQRNIPVNKLRKYASDITADPSELYVEYKGIPRMYGFSTNAGRVPANVPKNKYKDILPYDAHRVKLQKLSGDENSDYINASNIKGFGDNKMYIASQGPLERTLNDFWRMVWQQQTTVIVMLTNCVELGKMKCLQYWPTDDHVTFGDTQVTLLSQNVFSEYTIRYLQCSKINQNEGHLLVTQYHYTAWPDKDVPDTTLSLVNFWRQVRACNTSTTRPWIVHCSAGVGRTGTFIALDYLYEQGQHDQSVDVYTCVSELRQQRPIMVQTQHQYVYLYQALAEALLPIGAPCSVDSFHELVQLLKSTARGHSTHLYLEYEDLDAMRTDGCPDAVYGNVSNNMDVAQCADSFLHENLDKSRNNLILPPDKFRTRLGCSIEGSNDYINAVTVPIYQSGGALILSQIPLPHTVVDVLRLVVTYRVKVAVILEESLPQDCEYWPTNGSTAVIGPFTVEVASETIEASYIHRILRCTFNDQTVEVNMLHYTDQWLPDVTCPADQRSFLHLLNLVEASMDPGDISRPILVQCLDGCSKSGLFGSLLLILERIRCNNEVAVADCVRTVRERRRQAIETLDQYECCYDMSTLFLESTQEYANI